MGLNVKHKTINSNIGENLDDLGFGNDFLDKTPKAQPMKKRINKVDFIKIQYFCSVKDAVMRMKI